MAQQPEKNSDEKYPRTLILSSDPEISTPTDSRHTTCLLEGKSPSVKLMISVRTMQKSAHVFEVGFGQFFIFSARHQLDTLPPPPPLSVTIRDRPLEKFRGRFERRMMILLHIILPSAVYIYDFHIFRTSCSFSLTFPLFPCFRVQLASREDLVGVHEFFSLHEYFLFELHPLPVRFLMVRP